MLTIPQSATPLSEYRETRNSVFVLILTAVTGLLLQPILPDAVLLVSVFLFSASFLAWRLRRQSLAEQLLTALIGSCLALSILLTP